MRLNTVCHVGHTKTTDDLQRVIDSVTWMEKNGYTPPRQADFVELRKGRDFLKETAQYDVVILHFIFRGGMLIRNRKHNELATSPLSSWVSWRKRLMLTEAKLIFAFGGMGEIGGTFLADFDGYKTHRIYTPDFMDFVTVGAPQGLWIYEKLSA